MNLPEWMAEYAVNNRNLTPAERESLLLERDEVLKKAGTTMNTIRNAQCRGKIGLGLMRRLEQASKGTRAPFKLHDQRPELRPESD